MAHNRKHPNIVLQLRRLRQGQERFRGNVEGDKICFNFLRSASRSFNLLRTMSGSALAYVDRTVIVHRSASPTVLELQDMNPHRTRKVMFGQEWRIVKYFFTTACSDPTNESTYTWSVYCLHANRFLSRTNLLTGEIMEQCKVCDECVKFDRMLPNIEDKSLVCTTTRRFDNVRHVLFCYIAFITMHPLKLVTFSKICYDSKDTMIEDITENMVFMKRENSKRKVFTLHRLVDVLDMGTFDTEVLAQVDSTGDFCDIFCLGGENPVKYIVKTLTDDVRETFQVCNLRARPPRYAEYDGVVDSEYEVIPETIGLNQDQWSLPYMFMKNCSKVDIYHMKSAGLGLVGSIGLRRKLSNPAEMFSRYGRTIRRRFPPDNLAMEESYVNTAGTRVLLVLASHFSDQDSAMLLANGASAVYVRLYGMENCEMLGEKVLMDCPWSVDDVDHAYIDNELLVVGVNLNTAHTAQKLFLYQLISDEIV